MYVQACLALMLCVGCSGDIAGGFRDLQELQQRQCWIPEGYWEVLVDLDDPPDVDCEVPGDFSITSDRAAFRDCTGFDAVQGTPWNEYMTYEPETDSWDVVLVHEDDRWCEWHAYSGARAQ